MRKGKKAPYHLGFALDVFVHFQKKLKCIERKLELQNKVVKIQQIVFCIVVIAHSLLCHLRDGYDDGARS